MFQISNTLVPLRCGEAMVEIKDLDTPAFLVDKGKVEANCARMIDKCKAIGVDLRPHMKTHKCIEIGILQTGGTKRRICVSTVDEAEFFSKAGFEDILYAYPITDSKVERCKELAENMEMFHVMIDSEAGFKSLADNPLGLKDGAEGKKWSVFVSISCDLEREGVKWTESWTTVLPKALKRSDATEFAGTHLKLYDRPSLIKTI